MYKAFGLAIESDIALPALLSSGVKTADIQIKRAHVSTQGLNDPVVVKPRGQSAPNEVWFEVPEVARFYVTNGNSVCYEPQENSDEQTIQLYLLGTCMGVIMHQRELLVLHGNALRCGEHAIIFAGISGQGKSTLAAALYQRGYEVLADDLAVIDHNFRVQPAYPQLKVWQDVANKLDINVTNLNRIRLQIHKYAYPLTERFCQQALPVKAIYILNSHNEARFEVQPVNGMEKFNLLKQHTYRVGHLDGLGLKPQHLKLCAQLANQVDIFNIWRPNSGFELDKLIALIESTLADTGAAA